MVDNSKKNYISIAKAIGIILMVVGHSGCPSVVGRFIYLFHMPLFFVCSGYFFKEITNKATLIIFYKKKFAGLYVPYLKWSILFLLLHNLFFNLNIYNTLSNSYQYQLEDFVIQFLKTLAMTDYELLIRPFWFVKELLLSSLLVATISYISSRFHQDKEAEFMFPIVLFLAIITKVSRPIPIIGDTSILLSSTMYLYTGILFNKYKNRIRFTYSTLTTSLIIVIVGCIYYTDIIDMRYVTMSNLIPYYLFSLFGINMVLCISKILDKGKGLSYIYYIGNNTFPILALNLLALKVGNLIKIEYFNMPLERLSSYTIIHEHNSFFWIVYTIIGVAIPIIVSYIYKSLFQKKTFIFAKNLFIKK